RGPGLARGRRRCGARRGRVRRQGDDRRRRRRRDVARRHDLRADKPDDKLVNILQAANAEVRSAAALREAGLDAQQAQSALRPPPLRVVTTEPVDADADERGGFAFFAVLLLYGQLIGIGYFVAMGVVEEKSSRVVELLLSTLKPKHLLAGKILGL